SEPEDPVQVFTSECKCANQDVDLGVFCNHMMKRAAVRRYSARAINLPNNTVWNVLVMNQKFKKSPPLLRSEKDIVIDRKDIVRSRVACENQSVTGLCWNSFVNQNQPRVGTSYPVREFHVWVAIRHDHPRDKLIPQRAVQDERHVLRAVVRQKHYDACFAIDGGGACTEMQRDSQAQVPKGQSRRLKHRP